MLRVCHIHVPCHPQVLSAHQNHFCPLVRRGDQGEVDEAAMESAEHGPAASEVLMS